MEYENNEKFCFRSLLSWYFAVAIIFLLLGAVIVQLPPQSSSLVEYIKTILSILFSSIGVALFVSGIFDVAKETSGFNSFLINLAKRIVIDKEFVEKVDDKEKRKILRMILKPKSAVEGFSGNLSEYFETYIDDSLKIFKDHFRSGMDISVISKDDVENHRILCESSTDYRVYKIDGKFESLPIGFEDEKSKLLSTEIQYNGKKMKIEEKQEKTEKTEIKKDDRIPDFLKNDETVNKVVTQEIPKEFSLYNYLEISRKIVEYGKDHWQHYSYRTTKPCDRLIFRFKCEPGIEIQEINTFGSDNFIIDFSPEKTAVLIKHTGWLRPGFGISIIVSKNMP